jgi:hypothetical protein
MRFQRDESFDSQFDSISELKWYPYVGKRFGENRVRIMVYAHNIPQPPDKYDEKKREWNPKATWANGLEEYTYEQKTYTNAFRYFIKGAVGLKSNFCECSDPSVIERVDSFVERIGYLNFIQDIVKSENALARAEPAQVDQSKRVNREILRILGITHCVCWGKPTYEYVRSMTDYRVVSEKCEERSGFSSCLIDVGGGKTMRCLRIYHPSMPGFGPFSDATHFIISRFLGNEATPKESSV